MSGFSGRCSPAFELTERSARGGYAWAQAIHHKKTYVRAEQFEWLEKAVAQGEPLAIEALALRLWTSKGADQSRAVELWRRAAELGQPYAQYFLGVNACPGDSIERFEWLRRAAIQNNEEAVRQLEKSVAEQMQRYEQGGSGRIVFEIGGAFSAVESWQKKMGSYVQVQDVVERCVKLYAQWISDAERAVLCWMWLARICGVSKDIRRLIAGLIWRERCAWSERPPGAVEPDKP